MIPDEGIDLAVAVLAGQAPPLWVGLLCAAVPTQGSHLRFLQLEPTRGYHRQAVSGWVFDPTVPLEAVGDAVSFGPVPFSRWPNVVGYFLADAPRRGRAACYAVFDGPQQVAENDRVDVSPRVRAVSETAGVG